MVAVMEKMQVYFSPGRGIEPLLLMNGVMEALRRASSRIIGQWIEMC